MTEISATLWLCTWYCPNLEPVEGKTTTPSQLRFSAGMESLFDPSPSCSVIFCPATISTTLPCSTVLGGCLSVICTVTPTKLISARHLVVFSVQGACLSVARIQAWWRSCSREESFVRWLFNATFKFEEQFPPRVVMATCMTTTTMN